MLYEVITQGLTGISVSVTDDATWETVLDAEVSVWEPHPVNRAAPASRIKEMREEFTWRYVTAFADSGRGVITSYSIHYTKLYEWTWFPC